MSRFFEILVECDQCERMGFTSFKLYRLFEDVSYTFCSIKCRDRWKDTHPSDWADTDPRTRGE